MMIPLIDKRDIRKKTKRKRDRYAYLRKSVKKLIPYIYKEIDSALSNEIKVNIRDIAKKIGFENKSDSALYAGLRFVLFFEGIDVSIMNCMGESFFIMKRAGRMGGGGLPSCILKIFDDADLDGWYIRRNNEYLTSKYMLRKERNERNENIKDENGDDIYILESEGNIYFDRRSLTEEQALDFVKYMSGKGLQAPDFVYLTPINIVLSDEYAKNRSRRDDFDINEIGRELRIIKSDNGEFTVTSVYGKECTIYEFEIDLLIKGCLVRSMAQRFNTALMAEKAPERINILKKIIPEIKTKHIVTIENSMLIIINDIGIFRISILDGTLHKIYDNSDKYICVGPINDDNFIIYDGNKYEIDRITGAILSKMIMLLEGRYPDNWTKMQVMT